MEKMRVVNYKMMSHMNMSDQGILTHGGTIECVGHILHGKKLIRQVITPKTGEFQWGKGVAHFFVEGLKEDFLSFEDWRKHHGLPELVD